VLSAQSDFPATEHAEKTGLMTRSALRNPSAGDYAAGTEQNQEYRRDCVFHFGFFRQRLKACSHLPENEQSLGTVFGLPRERHESEASILWHLSRLTGRVRRFLQPLFPVLFSFHQPE